MIQVFRYFRTLIQASSWDIAPTQPAARALAPAATQRAASCDNHDEPCWSTDPSEDEDDDAEHAPVCVNSVVFYKAGIASGVGSVGFKERKRDMVKRVLSMALLRFKTVATIFYLLIDCYRL